MLTTTLPLEPASSRAVLSFRAEATTGAGAGWHEGGGHVSVVVQGCRLERRAGVLILIGTAALRCNWQPFATTLTRPRLTGHRAHTAAISLARTTARP